MNVCDLCKPAEILIVEDNPNDLGLIQRALKMSKLNSNLHVVRTSEDALVFLHQKDKYAKVPRPDLIILDLNLPRENGRKVLKEIKVDPKFKRIPVVVLTNSDDEDDISEVYDLYANCYIIKPNNAKQFIEVVQSIENFWITIVKLPSGE